jgi:hypothetical protein
MRIFVMPGLIVLRYKKRGSDNRDTALTQLHFVWNKMTLPGLVIETRLLVGSPQLDSD